MKLVVGVCALMLALALGTTAPAKPAQTSAQPRHNVTFVSASAGTAHFTVQRNGNRKANVVVRVQGVVSCVDSAGVTFVRLSFFVWSGYHHAEGYSVDYVGSDCSGWVYETEGQGGYLEPDSNVVTFVG